MFCAGREEGGVDTCQVLGPVLQMQYISELLRLERAHVITYVVFRLMCLLYQGRIGGVWQWHESALHIIDPHPPLPSKAYINASKRDIFSMGGGNSQDEEERSFFGHKSAKCDKKSKHFACICLFSSGFSFSQNIELALGSGCPFLWYDVHNKMSPLQYNNCCFLEKGTLSYTTNKESHFAIKNGGGGGGVLDLNISDFGWEGVFLVQNPRKRGVFKLVYEHGCALWLGGEGVRGLAYCMGSQLCYALRYYLMAAWTSS